MQPTPKALKKGSGKAIFLIIGLAVGVVLTALVTCIVLKMNSDKAPKTVEGAGYDSAEEAVDAYLNYLKEGNLEGVISTFAIESYVDNYDMEAYYDRIQQFNSFITNGGQMTTGFYFDSDMSRDLNIESRRAYILYCLHKQLMEIAVRNTDEEDVVDAVTDMRVYMFHDDDDIESVMDFLATDPELDSIEIKKHLDEDDYDFASEEVMNMAVKSLKKCWGSDIEQVVVEIEIGDEDYTLFMLCVCYDGKWYIADFGNPTGQMLGVKVTSKGLIPEEELF